MHFFHVKMELVLPVFFGCLAALFFCVLFSAYGLVLAFSEAEDPSALADAENVTQEKISAEEIFRFFTSSAETGQNPITELYQNVESQPWVTDFFATLCGSREIAQAILSSAEAFSIPPALAFALCWEESHFKPQATGPKNRDGTVDRGLFQLNSKSFPLLEQSDFFNINLNSWHGMGHLRYCLDTGGSEIAALAMYNAGTGKVRNQGAPKVTLDYVHRILQNRTKIEDRFRMQFMQEVLSESLAKAPSDQVRFTLLSPLMGIN